MNEHRVWVRIREAIGHRVRFKRVESPITPGLLDLNYLMPGGVEGWIELKYGKKPARESTAVPWGHKLTDEQRAEIEARIRLGGRAWIMAGVERQVYLIHGKHASTFNSMTVARLERLARVILRERTGPGDWEEIILALKERGESI